MKYRKTAAVLLAGLMLTASGTAISIDIDIIDLGGGGESDDSQNSTSNSTKDDGDDEKFTYGGEESDQITDNEVEKGLLEKIIGAIVNLLFG